MNHKRDLFWPALVILGLIGLVTGGCPQGDSPADSPGELTDAERAALKTAIGSAEGLAAAGAVTQPVADAENRDPSDVGLTLPTGDGSVTFGNCPQTTLAAEGASRGLSLDLNFSADGCTTAGPGGLACAGAATGSYNQSDQTLSVSFDTLSCANHELNGTADVGWSVMDEAVSLTGQWDITFVNESASATSLGAGTVAYDRADDSTTIAAFNGSASNANSTWSLVLSDVAISYPTYATLVPFSGEATVSGSDIRSLTIRFSIDSPTTQTVEVSVNGSPSIEVDLSEL